MALRKSLKNDIKGCLNKDLAATLEALFEAHNQLVAEFDALVDQLEADKADISTTDFAALVPAADSTVDIE